MPYDNVTRKHYDSGDYRKALITARDKIGFEVWRERQRRGEPDGRLIGIGFASYCEQTAHGTSVFSGWGLPIVPGYDQATVRVMPDGGLEVRAGVHSHGQGMETTMAQIAHEITGVALDKIRVILGDTGTTPYSTGTYASRSIVMSGGAVANACKELLPRFITIGAHLMQAAVSTVNYDKGMIAGPQKSIPLREVAEAWYLRPQDLPPDVHRGGLEATVAYKPERDTGAFSYASHASVVAVDIGTGEVEILDYVAVEDCGTLVNPMVVEGQSLGGIAQGIGTALYEESPDDPVMADLREAFSREHALQCGFCTPGMLIVARDIVQRLPNADERRIRVELSGNLCRCTGYRGIVSAVRSVVEARREQPIASEARQGTGSTTPLVAFVPKSDGIAAPLALAAAPAESRQGWTRFEEIFVLRKPPATVWNTFADIPTIAACLPGTTLVEYNASAVKGQISVKLGPIRASFAGSAVIEREDAALLGVIRGAGRDRGTGSRTKGEVTYRLEPEDDGRQTRVLLSVEYSLQGALAQFSRSGIAQDVGRRLVADFASNLNGRLAGEPPDQRSSAPLNIGRFMGLWLGDRIRRLFNRGRTQSLV